METENSKQVIKNVQTLLKLTYGIVPMVAGADKFTNLLTNWEQYLNPTLAGILPFSSSIFMMIVGVIEIIAGVLVLIKPQKGGYLVCAWLVLIAINLIACGKYFDIAVRDLVMAIGAYSLAKLSGINNINNQNQVQ